MEIIGDDCIGRKCTSKSTSLVVSLLSFKYIIYILRTSSLEVIIDAPIDLFLQHNILSFKNCFPSAVSCIYWISETVLCALQGWLKCWGRSTWAGQCGLCRSCSQKSTTSILVPGSCPRSTSSSPHRYCIVAKLCNKNWVGVRSAQSAFTSPINKHTFFSGCTTNIRHKKYLLNTGKLRLLAIYLIVLCW